MAFLCITTPILGTGAYTFSEVITGGGGGGVNVTPPSPHTLNLRARNSFSQKLFFYELTAQYIKPCATYYNPRYKNNKAMYTWSSCKKGELSNEERENF